MAYYLEKKCVILIKLQVDFILLFSLQTPCVLFSVMSLLWSLVFSLQTVWGLLCCAVFWSRLLLPVSLGVVVCDFCVVLCSDLFAPPCSLSVCCFLCCAVLWSHRKAHLLAIPAPAHFILWPVLPSETSHLFLASVSLSWFLNLSPCKPKMEVWRQSQVQPATTRQTISIRRTKAAQMSNSESPLKEDPMMEEQVEASIVIFAWSSPKIRSSRFVGTCFAGPVSTDGSKCEPSPKNALSARRVLWRRIWSLCMDVERSVLQIHEKSLWQESTYRRGLQATGLDLLAHNQEILNILGASTWQEDITHILALGLPQISLFLQDLAFFLLYLATKSMVSMIMGLSLEALELHMVLPVEFKATTHTFLSQEGRISDRIFFCTGFSFSLLALRSLVCSYSKL